MAGIHQTLLSAQGEIRHEFIVLMLTGVATPYLFNGTIQEQQDDQVS